MQGKSWECKVRGSAVRRGGKVKEGDAWQGETM